jgi:aryl-alcohol dehydrogenase-like predicted oxidoreductase
MDTAAEAGITFFDSADIYPMGGEVGRTEEIVGRWQPLDAIVTAGKARYIGVSNFLAYRLARAAGRTETLHLTRIASVQPRYNLPFRQIERELLALAAETGMAVIPFNPLAGVFSAARTGVTINLPKTGSQHR